MEVYKREVGYEDLGRAHNLTVTATTLYFPFLLTHNFEDMGIYTDVENTIYELVDLSGVWNLSNTGVTKPCLVLNNCSVNFTSSPITYYNANNGTLSAIVNGCPSPQTVTWSGPNGFTANTLTAGMGNLSPGSYTLKVTDAKCDITYASYVLQQPQSLNFNLSTSNSQTNATTPGGCDGTAYITPQGGQPPYTYLWYSGNTSNSYGTTTGVTSLCAGSYTVQVTDASGTIVSQTFTIGEPTPITGSVITTTNINCFGGNTGSITLGASGGINTPNGYKFILTGPTPSTITGSTGSAVFNNLLAGAYTIQIFDSVGNTITLPIVNITQPVAVTFTTTPTYVTCYDNADGIISITPTGGSGSYNVDLKLGSSLISPSQSGSGPFTWTDLDVGTYTIYVKDTNQCPAPTQTVTLLEKPKLNLITGSIPSLNGFNIPCYGGTTGVTFSTNYTTVLGVTYPITPTIYYYVDNVLITSAVGMVTSTSLTLNAGTHTIKVVDSIDSYGVSCSASTVVTITQPPMPLYISSGQTHSEDASCSGCPGTDNCRQGVISIEGGVTPYTISWSDGSTSITSNPHCVHSGPYSLTVTVTDINGCTITETLTLT